MTDRQKQFCEQCRYYLSIDETKGFCDNIQVNKTVRAAARSCGRFEPDKNYKPAK